MKLIHSLTRNRLAAKRVEKLCYIFINRRILDRGRQALHKLTDEELEEVEEDLRKLVASGYYQGTDEGGDPDSDEERNLKHPKRRYTEAFPDN